MEVSVGMVVSGSSLKSENGNGSIFLPGVEGVTVSQSLPNNPSISKIEVVHHYFNRSQQSPLVQPSDLKIDGGGLSLHYGERKDDLTIIPSGSLLSPKN